MYLVSSEEKSTVFYFTQEEINGRRFNADLWKKVLPTWSDGYKNLMEVIAVKEKK